LISVRPTPSGIRNLERWSRALAEAVETAGPAVIGAEDWGAGWDRDALCADARDGFPLMRRLHSLCDRLAERADATVEVRGRCIGPGFAVALHASSVAATAAYTWVGTREANGGLVPLLDTVHRLLERLPPSTATAMLLGDLVPAASIPSRPARASRRGIGQAGVEAFDRAGSSLPPGAANALRRLVEAADAPSGDRHELELEILAELLARPDGDEVRRRYFEFSGPDLFAPASIPGPVAVVGTGKMGTTIAAACAAAAIPTAVVGRTSARAAAAVGAAGGGLDRLARRGPLRVDPDASRSLLTPALEVPHDAWGVVEAVVEDPAAKRAVLDRARAAAPSAWLATTSSALPIDSLGPDIALAHFAFPAEVVPVVELSLPDDFDGRDRLLAWLQRLGKRAIEVADAPGYAVTRLVVAFVLEALRLHGELGIAPAAIDREALAAGFPLGPMSIADAGGLDLLDHVASRVLAPAHGARFAPHRALAALLADGRLGRDVGQGFYRWVDGRPVLDAESTTAPAATDSTVDRLRWAVADEAARCVEDGIAASEDIDVLAVGCARCFPASWIGPCASLERAVASA
jgi:3-hydroxyacyl-CoA dehydrogenase